MTFYQAKKRKKEMKYEGEIVMCQFLETLHLFWFFDMLINLITIKIEQKKGKKKKMRHVKTDCKTSHKITFYIKSLESLASCARL